MKFRSVEICMGGLVAGMLMLGTTTSAQADNHGGWTFGVLGGVGFADDHSFDIAGPATINTELDSGFVVGGAIGYDYGQVWELGNVRAELEVTHRSNDVSSHSLGAVSLAGPTGKVRATTIMANAIHEFLPKSSIRPYIGAGIGYAAVDFENYGVAAIPAVMNDDDGGFAYQFMAGATIDVVEKVELYAEYRFLGVSGIDVVTSAATGGNATSTDYDSHAVIGGLRFSL